MKLKVSLVTVPRWLEINVSANLGPVFRMMRRRFLSAMLSLGLVLNPVSGAAVLHAQNGRYVHEYSTDQRPRELTYFTLLGADLDPITRAVLYLEYVVDVPKTAIAEILGLKNDDKVHRELKRVKEDLRAYFNGLLDRPVYLQGVEEPNRAFLRQAVAEIIDGLSPTLTANGVELQDLLKAHEGQVKIIGLSKSSDLIKPILVQIPPGILPKGKLMSVSEPLVLTPDDGKVQRMAVTEARLLLERPDGSSVYVLQAFCLNENAKAPLLKTSFRFSAEDQKLLTRKIRDILKNADPFLKQDLIWQSQKARPSVTRMPSMVDSIPSGLRIEP